MNKLLLCVMLLLILPFGIAESEHIEEIAIVEETSMWDIIFSPFTVTDSRVYVDEVVKGDDINFKFTVYPRHVSEKSRFDIKLVSVSNTGVIDTATVSSYYWNQPMEAKQRYTVSYNNFPTRNVADSFCNKRMGFKVEHHNYYDGQYHHEKLSDIGNPMSKQFLYVCPEVQKCDSKSVGDKYCSNNEVRQKWQDKNCETYNKLISLCGSGCANGDVSRS